MSSLADARMLVSFFSLVGLTFISSGRGVLADDHPLVDLDAGADEELAALLEVEQRVAGRVTASVGDEHAALAQRGCSPNHGA